MGVDMSYSEAHAAIELAVDCGDGGEFDREPLLASSAAVCVRLMLQYWMHAEWRRRNYYTHSEARRYARGTIGAGHHVAFPRAAWGATGALQHVLGGAAWPSQLECTNLRCLRTRECGCPF